MWNWIADEIEKEKEVLNISNLKRIYCGDNDLHLLSDCFCCEYNKNVCRCVRCPLTWGEFDGCCNNEKTGLYDRVCDASTWQEQAKLARQIANLPERKDEEKVREAIAWLETKREIHKRGAYKSPIISKEQIDMIEGYYNLTIKALEKQLAQKVVGRSTVQDNGIVVGFVGRCPSCNEIIDDTTLTCDCGQKLDWTE